MKTLHDFNFKGKKVLVRVDFNVPLDSNGNILDDNRIKRALPTIKHLLDNNAKIILMSHLGRPGGEIIKNLRMDKVASRLNELLERKYNISKLNDSINVDLEFLKEKDIAILENLRFYKEEKNNDLDFAKKLASLADIYVNDAFGTVHRSHASVDGITNFIPCCAGFLIEKEIKALSIIEEPEHPFVLILGGAKVNHKINVIENLIKKADIILTGGVMANTFLKANNQDIGKSKFDESSIPIAKQLLDNNIDISFPHIKKDLKKILLPEDLIITDDIKEPKKIKQVNSNKVPDNYFIVDIGKKSLELYESILNQAKLVVWNGPLGLFEIKEFAKSTNEIVTLLSKLSARTIIGGGDTAEAVHLLKLDHELTHVSTGGGASLDYLAGKDLPGIKALERLV